MDLYVTLFSLLAQLVEFGLLAPHARLNDLDQAPGALPFPFKVERPLKPFA